MAAYIGFKYGKARALWSHAVLTSIRTAITVWDRPGLGSGGLGTALPYSFHTMIYTHPHPHQAHTGKGGLLLGMCLLLWGILECWRANSNSSYGLDWGISEKGVFRIWPRIRTNVLWELEGRKQPNLGSGLMDPSQLSLWLHYDPGLEDTKPPSPALTNLFKF